MNKNNCSANLNPCSGCGVCYAVCPVSAISYKLNSNGFYEGVIDNNKCISCGKCLQVCPKYIQQEKQLDKNTFKIYSFVHNDSKILANSSSGAVAWALVQKGIEKGYKVVGVEYNYSDNTAKASIASTLQQAEKFKGSKYIQANTSVYKDILKEKGKFIVFGTPCQIAGLAKAAESVKRREDFLLVDCFCHGVPSYLLWHSFLKSIDMEKPKNVTFRSKKGGWHNFCMELASKDKKYCADARINPFYKLFFSDLLLNDSCYNCQVKSATFADIRIGDFWGSTYDLTEKGVSLVLPLTNLGQKWIDILNEKGTLKDISLLRSKIIKSQSAFSKTVCSFSIRKKLFLMLKQSDFAQALATYQNALSLKKKFTAKIKSLLPLSFAKYIRYIVHCKQGY